MRLGPGRVPAGTRIVALALLGLDEQVVEVNVTPDRGYCFSVRGLGREYAHGARLDVRSAFRDPAAVQVPAAGSTGPPSAAGARSRCTCGPRSWSR